MASAKQMASIRRGIGMAVGFAHTEPWANYLRYYLPREKQFASWRLFNPLDVAQERAFSRTAHALHRKGVWV